MKARIFLYAFGVWLIFVVAAILNGGSRNSFITPRLGEYAGHVISSVILICFTLAVTYVFISRLKIQHNKAVLLLIGVFWFVLTVLFEFIFGHYVMGHPWSKLFADYNAFEGRLWSFVLLTVLIAPYLCGAILSKTKKE